MVRLLACAIVAAGCASIDDTPRPWIAAEAIAAPFTPELGPAPASIGAPTVLRIASWNIHRGDEPERIAEEIARSSALASAHVLLVQEIEDHPDEPGSRASRIAGALGMTWFYAPARLAGDGTHGDAILSRLPLTTPEVKQLPHVDQPINENQRIAQRATIEVGTPTLAIVNVHLDVRLAPVDRVRQLDPAVSDNPVEVVVGGDLNTLPWIWVDTAIPLLGTEAVIGQEQAAVVDDYLHAMGFETPIVPAVDTHETVYDVRLDTLCPRGWHAVAAGVDTSLTGSDHYAVWIDVVPE